MSWGVNPADPSHHELLWLAYEFTLAEEAGKPYDQSWEPDDVRLPFVHQYWMNMGAPTVSDLESLQSSRTADIPPSGHSDAVSFLIVIAWFSDISLAQAGVSSAVNPSHPDLSVSKGKAKATSEPLAPEQDALEGEEPDGGVSTLRIHRYASFTKQKQSQVLNMTAAFVNDMHEFAKKERLDPTAVLRAFNNRLGATKSTSWQAFQRLTSMQRSSRGKYTFVGIQFGAC